MLDWSELLVKPYGRDLQGRDLTLLDALVKPASARSPLVSPEAPKRTVLKDSTFGEVDDQEVDYEFGSPNRFFGSHVNLIPMVSAVQGQRPFYGARFYNQAMPVTNPEAPLVQNLDDETQESFDVQLGKHAGALRATHEGEVMEVTPDEIVTRTPEGEKRISLYNQFSFNRKSVSGESRIEIRRRSGVFWTGKIKDYFFQPGDQVRSIDPATQRSGWKVVLAKTEHENDKRLLSIRFESGRNVVVTEDHSLITLDAGGELTPILPDLCVVNQTRCPLVGWTEVVAGGDFNFGLLFGLYLACGSNSPGNQLNFPSIVPSRRAQIKNLIDAVLGRDAGRINKTGVTFADKVLKSEIRRLGGRLAGGKFVAAECFSKGREFLAGLVAGYMADDGCLHTDVNGAIQLEAYSTSEQLAYDLVNVLAALDIPTTRTLKPVSKINSKWADAYGFRVCSPGIKKLSMWFFYEDRESKLRSLLAASYRATAQERVPMESTLARKSAYFEIQGTDTKLMRKIGMEQCRSKAVGKNLLSKLTGRFGKWGRSDVLWDRIVEIVPVPHESTVYDLSVESSEAFSVNNGLLVHNTAIHQTPTVKPGDKFTKGQLLARSNYTDKDGTLAMGLNARIGLVPYLGHSMDDAVVISDAFAKRMKSQHMYGHDLDYKRGVKGGKAHFTGIFPNKYVNDQLDKLDDDGVVKPGTILHPGDPFILATRPRVISSQASQLGQLSKHMRNARSPAEMVWDEDEPGVVTDVAKLRNGVKVNILVEQPTKVGDKVVLRSGQKNIVSHIIPDEHMPRTVDGKPLEMLLNPMSLPSRVNNNLVFELALGKIARLTGKPYKLSGFNKPGEKWHQFVRDELTRNQLTDKEEVFDPRLNRKLENPIMVGDGFVLKLHHTGNSKMSARSQGSYDANMQPSHGSGPMAGSKRLSGLESYALLSSGAYNVMRDGATVRGTRNDDYWRKMRAGHTPEEPGAPFVWDKFKALLNGSGYLAKHLPDGALRLQMWRDQDLEEHKPIEVKNGDSVDIATLEPIKDGLFDPALTGANRWGYIQLPFKMPNPAAHDMIRKLLGLTEKEFRAVLAGQREL